MSRYGLSACFVVCVAALSFAVAGSAAPAVSPGSGAIETAHCPSTHPNTTRAPDETEQPGGYQNDALWTSLTMWSGEPGIVNVPLDGRVEPSGAIADMKWAWFRLIPGALTIDGRRLDGPAPPLTAHVPDGYGDSGFQVSGITFPTAGCWEITGHVAGASLTFVVLVIVPDGAPREAMPAT